MQLTGNHLLNNNDAHDDNHPFTLLILSSYACFAVQYLFNFCVV